VAQLTPLALTATAFYYHDAWVLSQVAALLGETQDARRYAELAAEIRQVFNKTFYHEETGQYATGSQCANAIPLVMGIAEPQIAPSPGRHRLICGAGQCMTAGDVSCRYLLRALARWPVGCYFAVNNNQKNQMHGFQLRRGATSLTEAWDWRGRPRTISCLAVGDGLPGFGSVYRIRRAGFQISCWPTRSGTSFGRRPATFDSGRIRGDGRQIRA
jgi:hypothetical protein